MLEAAFGLFLTHGYDGAGVAAVLAQTGLSKGAFYHHFSSKLELYREVIARFFPSPLSTLEQDAPASLDADSQKQVIVGFYQTLATQAEHNGWDPNRYYGLFFESLSRLPEFRAEVAKTYARVVQRLALALEREQNLGTAAAHAAAIDFIARLEGRLYLMAASDLEISLLNLVE